MQRIHKLKVKDGMRFINNPIDIYYFTGKKVSKGTVLVFPTKAVFFVDARYIDACKDMEGVEVYLEENGSLDAYLKEKSPKKIYIDGKTLTYGEYKHFKELLPEALVEESNIIEKIRSIKDTYEIMKMKRSGALNYRGYEYVLSILKEGITEKEVAWEYEKYCRENGAELLSFDPIIAFGENSAYPHYRSGDKKLEKAMAVLIDCGATLEGYASDMTRVLFFEKENNMEKYRSWKKDFDLVKTSYDIAFETAKIGVEFALLDEKVRYFAKENGVEKYLRHSLGHGLGLEVHEFPRLSHSQKNIFIEENIFFTIEPGLYFPGKWGIRYENTILMTKDGPIVISA
jgi:Xaa-Pro aminopeptidase